MIALLIEKSDNVGPLLRVLYTREPHVIPGNEGFRVLDPLVECLESPLIGLMLLQGA